MTKSLEDDRERLDSKWGPVVVFALVATTILIAISVNITPSKIPINRHVKMPMFRNSSSAVEQSSIAPSSSTENISKLLYNITTQVVPHVVERVPLSEMVHHVKLRGGMGRDGRLRIPVYSRLNLFSMGSSVFSPLFPSCIFF